MGFLNIVLCSLFQRCQREEGQALVEYALLTTLLATVTVTAFGYYTSSVSEMYNVIQDLFQGLSYGRL